MLTFNRHLTEAANTMIHAPGSTVAFPHKGKMTTGKVVRYEKGGEKLAPHYVIYHGEAESAKVPPHKVEKYGIFNEVYDSKFQRATKTDTHYTGQINGKTWVVPHAFHGNHDVLHGTKVTPIRHSIMVSPSHVQRNNPTLTPEESARVHSHIKDIHGGQDLSRLANLDEEERQQSLHLGMTRADRVQPSKEVPEVKTAETRYKKTHKPVKGTPEYQDERDKYRHAAIAASRKAATIAFAKKRNLLEIRNMLNEGRPIRGDVFSHHQTLIAKKTLRMPDAMVHIMGGPNKEESRNHLKKMGWTVKQIHDHEHAQFAEEVNMVQEHVWTVTDHLGQSHEVEAKDHDEAKKKTVSVGGVHSQGIPMSQWHKVRVSRKNLEESEQLNESFMSTFHRNEQANRHTENIVHLARHFGTPADHAEAKFYAAELKKHGHNIHHTAQDKIYEKLFPLALAAHHMKEGFLSFVKNRITASIEKSHADHNTERKKLHKSQFVKGAVGPTRLPKAISEEGIEQLDELKMPSRWTNIKHALGSDDRSVKASAHRINYETKNMSDTELHALHKSYGKTDKINPEKTAHGSNQHMQQRAIHREVQRRSSRPKTMDRSQFVKTRVDEEHSDTFNTIRRVLGGA